MDTRRTRRKKDNEEALDFYSNRFEVLCRIDEVRDYEPRTDENKQAMSHLRQAIIDCGEDLIGICSNLARVALENGAVRLGPGSDAEKRSVTLSDISILRAAVRAELRIRSADFGGDTDPEVVTLRRAMARLNPVQLLYYAIHSGSFRYTERTADKNGISIFLERQRYFGGIPKDKLPISVVENTVGNLTERVAKTDLRIYPENAQRIYEILKLLEKENPVVELSVPGSSSNIIGRTVNRAGEAEFFLSHLPKGLKPRDKTA